jgi:predicted regulator of Ras-like GTPase activity (Roadblock/LC7/MglB family)
MADLSAAADIEGFVAACLVDSDSGLMLASEGGGQIDMEAAAALNTQVVKAKLQAMELLGSDERVEEILIGMGKQIHLIRPLERMPEVFLYLVLEKRVGNLGLERRKAKTIEAGLVL